MWCTHVANKPNGFYALWQNENLVNIWYGSWRSLVTRSLISVPMKMLSCLKDKSWLLDLSAMQHWCLLPFLAIYRILPWKEKRDHENEFHESLVISNILLKIHDNNNNEWKWHEQQLLQSQWCHWFSHWKISLPPSCSSRCDDIGGQIGFNIECNSLYY